MSLRSLHEATGSLVEMNQEVVCVVLSSKHDVWECAVMFAFVEGYFDASLHTLDFLTALDRALRRARDSHLALQVQDPAVRHARVLNALQRFKADLFTDEFFATFQAAYRQQLVMLDRLRRQKRRMRSVRVWRRVTVVVFATIFTAILTDKASPMRFKGASSMDNFKYVYYHCNERFGVSYIKIALYLHWAAERGATTVADVLLENDMNLEVAIVNRRRVMNQRSEGLNSSVRQARTLRRRAGPTVGSVDLQPSDLPLSSRRIPRPQPPARAREKGEARLARDDAPVRADRLASPPHRWSPSPSIAAGRRLDRPSKNHGCSSATQLVQTARRPGCPALRDSARPDRSLPPPLAGALAVALSRRSSPRRSHITPLCCKR
ncbi:putative UPF0496 protein 5 [Hordeum vulgare]|nr:putative UPF0496 protein 5 [Hordeum vulgare]